MLHSSLEENNPVDPFPLFYFIFYTTLVCYGHRLYKERTLKLPSPFLCLSSSINTNYTHMISHWFSLRDLFTPQLSTVACTNPLHGPFILDFFPLLPPKPALDTGHAASPCLVSSQALQHKGEGRESSPGMPCGHARQLLIIWSRHLLQAQATSWFTFSSFLCYPQCPQPSYP